MKGDLPPVGSLLRASLGLLAAASVTLAAPGCSGGGGEQGSPAQAQTPGGGGKKKNGGPGGAPEVPAIPVAVETVSRGPIASFYSATATLEPSKEAEIQARVPGVILEILAEEGDRVTEGQVLLKVEEREFRYRLKQATAEYEKQKTRFGRMQKMFEGNLASAEEFDTARNDLTAAEAAAELAELELSRTRVKAPFTGYITRRHVDPGQTVSNGTVLYSIADLDPLLARVHVPSKAFRNIQVKQPVELTLDSSRGKLAGRITLVSPIIDPSSGTIKVTVEVEEYPPDTRPGDFAEVRIVTDRHEEALVIPRTAVISERSDQIVYVAGADSTAERRVVQTGFEDDRRIEITSGLEPGELVVVQGQRSLKAGAAIRIMDAIVFDEPEEAPEES